MRFVPEKPSVLAVTALLSGLFAFAAEAHEKSKQSVGEPGDSKSAQRTILVTMNDRMRFVPARISVGRGETIRFVVKNVGEIRHEMTLGTIGELRAHAEQMQKFPDMEHEEPNMATVEPGKTGEIIWKFTEAGTVDFACLMPGHYESGMAGKIVVAPTPRSATQPK